MSLVEEHARGEHVVMAHGFCPSCQPRFEPRRLSEPGFTHNTVQVLSAFATAVIGLHRAIHIATDATFEDLLNQEVAGDAAAAHARAAVRAARMLVVKDEYK